MLRVLWMLSDLHACGTVRADVPARAIAQYHRDVFLCCKRDHMLSDLFAFDVFVMQRACTSDALMQIERAKQRGIKIIYDIDDDLFNIAERVGPAHAYFSRPDVRQLIAQCIGASDLVTSSTSACADAIKTYAKSPIVIVKNCIDWGHAKFAKRRAEDGRVVVGWFGSSVHRADAPLVDAALARVLSAHSNVHVQLCGNFEPSDFPESHARFAERISINGWIAPNELYAYIARWDVALCPISPHKFNDAKSEIKWVENGAVGVPCVLSPVIAYSSMVDGVDCLKAAGNSESGWFDAINALVSDKGLRERIGGAARERVSREYDSRVVAQDWVNAFRIAERM